jgi:hypothetical protein
MDVVIYFTQSVLIGVAALAIVWTAVLIGFELLMGKKVVAHESAIGHQAR